MDTYASLYSTLLHPAWEALRGRETLTRLRYLRQMEWRSTDELIALQTSKLRRLLQHAYATVPAYRSRIDQAGLDPSRLRHLDEIRRLPLLTREQAQREETSLISGAHRQGLLCKSTSGTTGNPFRFSYNLDSEVWRQAVKLRAYGWAGWVPGQKTLHYWGPPAQVPTGWKRLKIEADRALRREVYLDCGRQAEKDLFEVVELLRRWRPACLIGFTQATVELGRFIVRRGLRDWPAMNVLLGAERLFPENRAVLTEAFGEEGSVYETYGCREFMLIASECPAHQGLHTSMENLIVEIVDERGAEVPAGRSGQVAITDLHNYGMPLIRYVTGDLAVACAPGKECLCGRGLVRLESLEGRQADLLRGRDGRGIPGLVFNSIIASLGGKIDQFQVVQRRDGHIALKMVPGPEFDSQVVDGLKDRLRPYIGDLPLSVDVVPLIPTSPSGKRRHVVIEGA